MEGTADATTGGAPPDSATTGGPAPATSGLPPTSASSEDDGSTGLPAGEGCCEAHAGPGCNESAVQMCVCELDATCCGFDWTTTCAELATGSCAAACMPDPVGTTGRTSAPTDDSGGTFGSGSTGEFAYESCCVPHGGLSCWHESTATCVCEIDASCCDTEWNEGCVTIATESCNVCNTDDCCAPQGDAGCADAAIQACVCELDGFCCKEMWDEICIDAAVAECKASCVSEREPRTPPEPGTTSG
jgi:hypothetical protein